MQIVEEFIAQIFETLKIQIWVKTKSKQPLKWVDIYLKYIFISLKNYKGNTIIWIVNIYFWNKLHYFQSFNVQNLMQIRSSFACLKHSNL